jgi:S-adenosylmethionine hydrolase
MNDVKKVIALLTDFGTEDGYVGAMKGKILSMAPEVSVVDISHQIEPFNTRQAAFCLSNCYSFFPEKTVFVIVVDPGVGTVRRGLVIQTAKYIFVGPDNGVFSFVYEKEAFNSFEINQKSIPWKVSPTFHGRDVFSPLAALLGSGKSIRKFLAPSKKNESFIKPIKKMEANRFKIPVAHIDHFGNVILNFQKKDYTKIVKSQKYKITFKKFKFKKIRKTFGNVSEGKMVLVWDSSGYLQIAKNAGNAAMELGIDIDDDMEMIL